METLIYWVSFMPSVKRSGGFKFLSSSNDQGCDGDAYFCDRDKNLVLCSEPQLQNFRLAAILSKWSEQTGPRLPHLNSRGRRPLREHGPAKSSNRRWQRPIPGAASLHLASRGGLAAQISKNELPSCVFCFLQLRASRCQSSWLLAFERGSTTTLVASSFWDPLFKS